MVFFYYSLSFFHKQLTKFVNVIIRRPWSQNQNKNNHFHNEIMCQYPKQLNDDQTEIHCDVCVHRHICFDTEKEIVVVKFDFSRHFLPFSMCYTSHTYSVSVVRAFCMPHVFVCVPVCVWCVCIK